MANKILPLAEKAKKAAYELSLKGKKEKTELLHLMSAEIKKQKNKIIKENNKDIENAKKNKLAESMIDRLLLTSSRIDTMAEGVAQVAKLPDPTGEVMEKWKRPNGMQIQKVRVPIGLIGMIYESRPNVTADASSLCLKSGNGCLLRGGKEALHSNKAIVSILQSCLKKKKFDPYTISFIDKTDRKLVEDMLSLENIIDVIIPRGGKSLIKMVSEKSRIPVIKHYDGNCHVYVDKKADLSQALKICINAKTQRPGVCNAAETILIHRDIANKFLPILSQELLREQVEIRGCSRSKKILKNCKLAKVDDWYSEYLDLIVAIKIVDSLEEAITHINQYGSKHTDCIVSKDKKSISIFQQGVESAAVFANVSTRLNDGFEFGFGAEIGISTDKIHARGPVGLKELTTYKYLVEGNCVLKVPN